MSGAEPLAATLRARSTLTPGRRCAGRVESVERQHGSSSVLKKVSTSNLQFSNSRAVWELGLGGWKLTRPFALERGAEYMGELTNGGRAGAFEALRASEELHRATLTSISDAVFLTDDEGAFKFVCPNV